MKRIPNYQILAMMLGLLLLPSCATERPTQYGLPHDIDMNKDAGREGLIFVPVMLNDGEKLLFLFDTGTSTTSFDKSLEPKLGKCVGTGASLLLGRDYQLEVNYYDAPSLSLGRNLLMTGRYVDTIDCSNMSSETGHKVMGILGMDILSHYCIQLDFSANKIRFISDSDADKSNWGKVYPLKELYDSECFCIDENLGGVKGSASLIDSGFNQDGWLMPRYFQEVTNQVPILINGVCDLPNARLGSEVYSNVVLYNDEIKNSPNRSLNLNGIGLRFLSRHLVTFDFPQETMYLKRTSVDPLMDDQMKKIAVAEIESAWEFLNSLRRKSELPGWSKSDKKSEKETSVQYFDPDLIIFGDIHKKEDLFLYHYVVTRSSKKSSWKIEKAWRTDQSGHVVKEYSGF